MFEFSKYISKHIFEIISIFIAILGLAGGYSIFKKRISKKNKLHSGNSCINNQGDGNQTINILNKRD